MVSQPRVLRVGPVSPQAAHVRDGGGCPVCSARAPIVAPVRQESGD